jgi:tRNA pseudouridine38-40 synthase
MRNIKLKLAYDGGEFHGWQMQPGLPTVQGAIRDVLQQITQEELTVNGAGRTDAGVHAWGQVANFKTQSQLAPGDFLRACNAMLPPSVRVRAAEEDDADFHARWLARAKIYQYRIYRARVVPPFCWRYVLHDPFPLDFAAMADAARHFEGQRDFTTFAASSGSEDVDQERSPIRNVFRSQLLRAPAPATEQPRQPEPYPQEAPDVIQGRDVREYCGFATQNEWIYVVRGQSFLRNMVRKMVGTLLEVGRGRLAVSDIPALLERRDRTCSGPTAPPQGLCLASVEYDDVATGSGLL